MQKLVIITTLLITLFIIFLFRGPGYLRSAEKFKQFVVTHQPVLDAIEKWSKTVNLDSTTTTSFVSIPPQDWPQELRTLAYGHHKHPAYVDIRDQPKAVMIIYGGGLGHWGLIMDISKSDRLEGFKKDYLLRVNDRDVVWWELQDANRQ